MEAPPKIVEFESEPSLETFHETVGGYIELVPYFKTFKGRSCHAFCNTDGKMLGLEVNMEATNAWYDQCPAIVGHDVLVGNIAIVYGRMR